MTMIFDFPLARIQHLEWKIKIRKFLDGRETLTAAQAVSHTDCDLGKWFYSKGKAKYGHLAAMQQFEGKHKTLHDLVREIQALKEQGNKSDAEKKYMKLLFISNEIIDLLDELEETVG